MKTRRPKTVRTIREGDARRAAQRAAEIRQQLQAERDRHRIALQDIAARRSQAALRQDPDRRSVEMARVTARAAEEDRRHRTKIDAITKKISRR